MIISSIALKTATTCIFGCALKYYFDTKVLGVKPRLTHKAGKDYKKLTQEVFDRINPVGENPLKLYEKIDAKEANPKGIILELAEMLKKFKGNLYDNKLRTHEGPSTVEEGIEFAKEQQNLPLSSYMKS